MGITMDVKYEITDDILIARLSGELDHHSATMVRKDIDQAIDAFQAVNLILILEQVSFMDSAGIGVVVGRYNKMKGRGGRIFLTGGGEYLRRILEMSGVYTIIDHYEKVEDVVRLIERNREEGKGGDRDETQRD
ncbi:MAG: STAS domain-containing protein [Anaerovoracaceae bacterium]|jgi:stage II sporulation protein AA (anti-sigma F factor antagonist)